MEAFTNVNLIQKLQEGDETIFAYVYEKYHNAVFANICKLISNDTDAEDILQEVFVLLWASRFKLTENQQVGGWLFSTSYYKSLEFLRKSVKESVTEFEETSFEAAFEIDSVDDREAVYEEKLAILNDAIELLSPQKKSAFTLCRIHGKSYEEAANQMGVSTETVRGYVKDSANFLKHYATKHATSLSAFGLYCLIRFL